MSIRSSVPEPPWILRHLSVPREDSGILVDPPFPTALEIAKQNHAVLSRLDANVQGRSLQQMRHWAREEVLRSAEQYTAALLRSLGDDETTATASQDPSRGSSDLLFVSGHQPALFHPGVWIKNFAVNAMARRTGGQSLSLSVDTDVMGATQVRVPTGDRVHPRVERVRFDADRPGAPWEENAIIDRDIFESFGSRAAEMIAAWGTTSLVKDFWADVVRASHRFDLLRDCFVAARSRLERRWGAGNLELPISRICELDPFLWFASHILAHLPQFCEIHNEILGEYRRINHVRSRTHPVPELGKRDGWVEAPFWVWRRGDSVRSRLLAKQVGREVILSNGKQEFARLPLSPEMDACCAVEVLRQLPTSGIRLRARALTTTLFSRMCLADLFVHGIGGAKYDEMTDRIIARFFGIAPPGFLTLTATLYPSLAEPFPGVAAEEKRLSRLLRDLRWNPDRHLNREVNPRTAALVAEKRELVGAQRRADDADAKPARSGNRMQEGAKRFRRIQHVNRELHSLLTHRKAAVETQLADIRQQAAANAILQDRQYAFCLYPEDKLRKLMTSLPI
jgi:hypothetical protein